MSRQKSRDGLQSIPSMAPAAYCMPLRNTELIPARSSILRELAGLGTRNALVLTGLATFRVDRTRKLESPGHQKSVGIGRAKTPTEIHSPQGPKFNCLRDGNCASDK